MNIFDLLNEEDSKLVSPLKIPETINLAKFNNDSSKSHDYFGSRFHVFNEESGRVETVNFSNLKEADKERLADLKKIVDDFYADDEFNYAVFLTKTGLGFSLKYLELTPQNSKVINEENIDAQSAKKILDDASKFSKITRDFCDPAELENPPKQSSSATPVMSYSTYRGSLLGGGSEIPTLSDSFASESNSSTFPQKIDDSTTPRITYFDYVPSLWVEGVSEAPDIGTNSSQSSFTISSLENNGDEGRRIELFQPIKDPLSESGSEKINSKFNIEFENQKNINIDLSVFYGPNNDLVKFKVNINNLIELYLRFKTDNEDDKSSYIVFNDKTVSFDKIKIVDQDLSGQIKEKAQSIFEIGNFLKTHFPNTLQAQINQKKDAEVSQPNSRINNVSSDNLMKVRREFKF